MTTLANMLAAAQRLLTYYNGNEKTAQNPGGLTGVGGMADNWDPCIQDIGTVGTGVGDALTAVTTSEGNAAASATAAAGSAAGAAGSAAAAHADRLAADVAAQATAANRTAVAADKSATHADRLAADADAAATAADRIAVATDKTAAHADRLAADADAQATAADRLAVAVDKATVAADKTATHADRLAADAAAAAAQGYAAGLSLPAINVADVGKALIVNPAGSGYVTGNAGLPAATGAQTAAGISDLVAVTPAALAGWIPNLAELPAASVDPTADRIPIYDASGSVVRWVRPSSIGGGSGGIAVQQGGVAVASGITTINVAGNATVSASGTTATITVVSPNPNWTFDPAYKDSDVILSAGNTVADGSASAYGTVLGSVPFSFLRVARLSYDRAAGSGGGVEIGVATRASLANDTRPGQWADGWGYSSDGTLRHANSPSTFGASYAVGDYVDIIIDSLNGRGWFAKNGTVQGGGNPVIGSSPAFTFSPSLTLYPAVYVNNLALGSKVSIIASVGYGTFTPL